jgi:hypothetical protein
MLARCRFWLSVCGVLIAACDSGQWVAGEKTAFDPPVVPTPSEREMTDALFARDRVVRVDIDMAPADWDALRKQTRSILDVVGSTCLSPPESPFTFFAADVSIDGVRATQVGVRKKGFYGSLDETKPSLIIDLEELGGTARVHGIKRLTLNNNKADPSQVKQCLGYDLFRRAGVAAPRCGFAKVVVNGRNLGLFTLVEGIKKQFLRVHFGDDSGNLYEGALSDFRAGWVDTFQRKTNESDLDRSDIESLVPLLDTPPADLRVALASHLDVDAFITFWAMELLVGHVDGYARNTNNFYLYHDETTGLLRFIPWGIDAIMFEGNQPMPWETEAPPVTVWAEGMLARRLYDVPQERDRYFARLETLLDTVWDESALLAELDALYRLLAPEVDATLQDSFAAEVARVRGFISGRRALLDAELAKPRPAWSKPLRDPWCVDALGDASATFQTTWDTLAATDIFAVGSGTMSVTYKSQTLGPPVAVGAKGGIDPASGNAQIQIAAWDGASHVYVLVVALPPALLVAGTSVPLDWVAGSGYLADVLLVPGGEPVVTALGALGEGVLELTQAPSPPGQAGAPFVGKVTTRVWEAFAAAQ